MNGLAAAACCAAVGSTAAEPARRALCCCGGGGVCCGRLGAVGELENSSWLVAWCSTVIYFLLLHFFASCIPASLKEQQHSCTFASSFFPSWLGLPRAGSYLFTAKLWAGDMIGRHTHSPGNPGSEAGVGCGELITPPCWPEHP